MKPILIDQANDITSFASSDHNRRVLQGVHFRKDFTEATDGRVMIRVPYVQIDSSEYPPVSATDSFTEGVIVPVKAVKDAIKTIPKCNLPVLNTLRVSEFKKGETKTTQLVAFDLDQERMLTSKNLDGQFPNTDQVMPTEEPKFSVTLNAECLKRVCEYAMKHGKETGKNGYDEVAIKFDFTDALSPVRFEIALTDGRKATGVQTTMKMV